MNQNEDEVLGIASTFGVSPRYELFRLHGCDNKWLMTIKHDGTLEYNKSIPMDELASKFWEAMAASFNLVENGIANAKLINREEAANVADALANQWGMLRSLKMTHYTEAARKIAEAIRQLP